MTRPRAAKAALFLRKGHVHVHVHLQLRKGQLNRHTSHRPATTTRNTARGAQLNPERERCS